MELIGTPSVGYQQLVFCIDPIVLGFVVYYINTQTNVSFYIATRRFAEKCIGHFYLTFPTIPGLKNPQVFKLSSSNKALHYTTTVQCGTTQRAYVPCAGFLPIIDKNRSVILLK